MNRETQAILLNAVPLLVLAAAYLGVGAALAPTLWRERKRASLPDFALASVFPGLGVPAAIWGGTILADRAPIGGHAVPALVGILVALVPALVFLLGWRDRTSTVLAPARAREAEARVSARERELDSVTSVSNALVVARDEAAVARTLLERIRDLDFQFAGLALVDDDLTEAREVLAVSADGDATWFGDETLDLVHEPSGVASAVREAAPVTVFDAQTSPIVSRRLAEGVQAKSAAFIPLISGERVLGVLAVATTHRRRSFAPDEVALLQAIASEAALALERLRSEGELERALERERLIARIGRDVRSQLDVEAVLTTAVRETGEALGLSRCLIRLGDEDAAMPVVAEWHTTGLEPVSEAASRLADSNLAARDRRTVAVGDLEDAPELDDDRLGGRDTLRALGARAVLATPIVVFERMIGVFSLHANTRQEWDDGDLALAEAVAREAGLAVHTARLLRENEERLTEQAALLEAAQVVTSELELEAVIQRLVDELAALLHVPAADCFLYDPTRRVVRCAAVHGLDPALVGFEFPADRGVAGEAISTGRVARSDAYGSVADPVPHRAYEGFTSAMVAPMTWGGEIRGVLGVGLADDTRRFDSSQADVLEAFAGLASLAHRNAESFRERSRQARVQRGFYRIASLLGQSLSLRETLAAVAVAAADALGAAFAAVVVPGRGGPEVAISDALPELLQQHLREGLADASPTLATAARDGKLIASPSVAEDERFAGRWGEAAASCGFRSLLAIPVERDARDESPPALVLAFFEQERTFSDDDVELAHHVAEAARGALVRSELFEAERSARALAQQFARTTALLATELDPAAVLDEVVAQAAPLIGAEAAAIRVLDGPDLVVQSAHGEAADEAIGSRASATGFLAGDVVQSRTPLAVPDVSGDARYGEADPMLRAGYNAYLGVPLIGTEGTLHGVLSVYGTHARQWREEEIDTLVALAGNASVALSNAELYQRVAVEKERNDAILANVADGIVAVDRDGAVVLWNAAAETVTGVPATEAIGRTPEQVLQRRLTAEEGEPTVGRLVSIHRGREEVWLSLSEAVMRDPSGAVAGRIFTFRDISTERLIEQMKSDFVSTVSQQLRTPLTSIYGFAETLLRSDVLFGEEERRTFLGYIASESERLTRIVDTLLNVARLDTGDLTVQTAPTEVRQVVSEAMENVQEAAAANGHRFVLDLPPEPLTADADRDKLRQIVSILVDNAVKYSPDGGTVTVAARRKQSTVEVSVVDEGVGIAATERQRIFTKFYRGATATVAGTGLGLFIAKGLVAAMGGRIWVDSEEGHGSSFVFELPLARVPAGAAE